MASKATTSEYDENSKIQEIPLPPPLYLEELPEELLADVPGIVKKNSEGTWVKRFITYRGFGKFLTEIYDNWINNRLRDQLEYISVDFRNGSKLCFTDVFIEPPRSKKGKNPGACQFTRSDFDTKRDKKVKIDKEAEDTKIYPWDAKRDNKTYALSVYAKPTFIDRNDVVTYLNGESYCHIGDIPVMLRSEHCNMSKMSDLEMISKGEDPDTAIGYFIIEGKKKVVMNYEKVRLNKPLLYRYKTAEVICRTTFENYNGTSIVEVSYSKDMKLDIYLSSLNCYGTRKLKNASKMDRADKKLNVFHIFRYLTKYNTGNGQYEYESFDNIIRQYIYPFVKAENRAKIVAVLSFTINNLVSEDVEDLDSISFLANKMSISKHVDPEDDIVEITIEEMDRILNRDLFPTLNNIASPEDRDRLKLLNLGAMVARLSEYMAGLRQLDNRDLWSNKRLESAGRAMEQYFRILWGHMLKKSIEKTVLSRYSNYKESGFDATDHQPLWLLNNIYDKIGRRQGSENEYYKELSREIVKAIRYDLVTISFNNAFAKKWQIKGVYSKENVVQELKTDNKVAALSHLLRLDIEGSHHGTSHDIRHIQPDQYGYICAVHTPDGGPCGMVKNMAVTCEISKGLTNDLEIELIERITDMRRVMGMWYIPNEQELKREEKKTKNRKVRYRLIRQYYDEESDLDGKFYINGRFLGWCNSSMTYKTLYRMKLEKEILNHECSVSLDGESNIYLFTDNSRVIRPLLLVNEEGNKLVYEEMKEKNPDVNFSFSDLLNNKAATYVDPHEQTYIKLASYKESLREFFQDKQNVKVEYDNARAAYEEARRAGAVEKNLTIMRLDLEKVVMKYKRVMRRKKYTHCELHPQALLSTSASIIPAPQTNQSARNTFQAGTATQALSIYHPNQRNRFDGKTKLLAYPSNPIFSTEMESVLHVDKTPQGNNVIVAFMSHPMTGEDAFVFSQKAVDLGLFTVIKYVPYTVIVHSEGKYVDNLRPPTEEEIESDKQRDSFHAIGDDGLPAINSKLKHGDVVISCFRTDRETGDMVKNHIILGAMEEGIVNDCSVTNRSDNSKIVRVTLRTVRKPKIGDKYAARNAQKGTISYIMKPQDLPFTETGMTPDIIVNPHAIPSRMTLSYMIEILTGKVGAITGERINATPFEKIDLDKFFTILYQLGFNRGGTEVMYSGTTGEILSNPIFIGPAYFQALRHHVDDKNQNRGKKGAVKLSSRQPVEGRSRGGGLRFGEMERDSLLAHGASYFLRERLRDLSDAIKTAVCGECGCLATPEAIKQVITCNNCGVTCSIDDTGKFGKITIPYAFSLLRNLIGGLNIELKFTFGTQDHVVSEETDTFEEAEYEEKVFSGDGDEDWEGEEIDEGEGDMDEEI